MATVNYTSLLGLALPTTGDLSGQWGNEVNEYISKYVDASVAGTQTISGSQTVVTLSPTTGASLTQVGSGAGPSTGSSQYAIINCTGTPASTLTITVSYSSLTNAQFSKTYAVINATSTSQSVVVRATTSSGTSSGVTVASGERCLITWNGSDFVKVSSTVALPAGSTTQVQYNNAGALAGSANLTFDGTNLTSGGTVSGTKFIPTGGAATGNGMYLPSANTLGFSTNGTLNMSLDSSGNLGIGTSSPSGKLHVSGDALANTFKLIANTTVSGSDATIFRPADNTLAFSTNGAERARIDSSGNLGLGVTPSAWVEGTGLNVGSGRGGSIFTETVNYGFTTFNANAYYSATNTWRYVTSNAASRYQQLNGVHSWYNAASGTAGNAITFTQAMTLDASGNLGVGQTSMASDTRLHLNNTTNNTLVKIQSTFGAELQLINGGGSELSVINASGNNVLVFRTGGTERARITAAGFTQPVAYADTVSALGNTGTAKTIDLQTANVFTATLTGNCTFTLSNPIATGSSSFTLILTNDGTAGRTVAWAGGAFRFPGGAASLSRTTTANATDIWVFFTPDGGTTWYGNIAMKNMAA